MLHLPPAASRIVFLVVECVHGGAVGQRQLPPSGANLLVNALLVNWLLTFMDAHGLDYIGDQTEDEASAEAVVE